MKTQSEGRLLRRLLDVVWTGRRGHRTDNLDDDRRSHFCAFHGEDTEGCMLRIALSLTG